MSTVTRQWLTQQQRHPPVHKWEKRWVSRGNMMIFKWVKTENRAGTGSEEKEVEIPAEESTLAEGFLGAEGGTRRLTRGKAADMGITVESIADTNDTLLSRALPGENPRVGEKPRREFTGEDGSAQSASPAEPSADGKAEQGSDAGKKRRREDEGEDAEGDTEAKRSRVEAAENSGGSTAGDAGGAAADDGEGAPESGEAGLVPGEGEAKETVKLDGEGGGEGEGGTGEATATEEQGAEALAPEGAVAEEEVGAPDAGEGEAEGSADAEAGLVAESGGGDADTGGEEGTGGGGPEKD